MTNSIQKFQSKQDWIAILSELRETSSTLKKKKILLDYFKEQGTENLVFLLLTLQNDFSINTYLSTYQTLGNGFNVELLDIAKNSKVVHSDLQVYKYFLDTFYTPLKSRQRFNKADWMSNLKKLATYFTLETLEGFELILKALIKDLKIGVSIKTFNYISQHIEKFPTLESFEVMKVANIADTILDFQNNSYYVSVKKDGVNCTAIDGEFFTRNGKSIWLPHIAETYNKHFQDYVLFGELVAKNSSRQSSSGIVNSALKLGDTSKLPIDQLELHVFDILPKINYHTKTFNQHLFTDRLSILESLSKQLYEHINFVKHIKADNYKHILDLNRYYMQQGEEGVVINQSNGIYEPKRSKFRTKIKVEATADFKVVDIIPHKRNLNWVGSLIVESSCGKITSSVGSGFRENERQQLFTNNIIGKIVEVKYNDIITEGNKTSLFLPIFKRMRLDKDEYDSYESAINAIKSLYSFKTTFKT